MTDVRVARSETLSRAEAARWLQALSTALAKGGDVTLPVGGVTVGVHVPDKVRAEFEIEVEGDQVEIELEFSWRTTAVPEFSDRTRDHRARDDGASLTVTDVRLVPNRRKYGQDLQFISTHSRRRRSI